MYCNCVLDCTLNDIFLRIFFYPILHELTILAAKTPSLTNQLYVTVLTDQHTGPVQ